MASTSFTLSPAIDLPLSVKSSTTSSQSVPLFPYRPLNSPSFRYKLKRNVAASASVSRSNAVSEQLIDTVATDATQDSQTTLSQPSSSKLVLVVGATGGVGQLVVASLLDRNVKARLLLRNLEKAAALFGEQDEEKLQVRQGDTRNPEDLDPSIFEGVTHVICCTGTTAFPSRRWDGDNSPERVDWEGVRNLVSALPSSLKRIVLVSSVGVTKCNELPWSIMNLFGVLKYKKMGEDFLRNSGLPYTIIRPGRLTDGPYTSYDLNTLLQATAGERRAVVIDQGDKLVGETSRLVVAEACIQALDIDFTQGQIYEINSVQKRIAQPSVPLPTLSLSLDLSRRHLLLHHGEVAFIDASTGRRLTFADLWRAVDAVMSLGAVITTSNPLNTSEILWGRERGPWR